MLEVGEVSENPRFLEVSKPHFRRHFAPLEPIWAAFWRPGRPPGTLFGTLAVQGAKIDDFGVPPGHLLGAFWIPFGHQNAQEGSKT